MKKLLLSTGFFLSCLLLTCTFSRAQDPKPDTVKVGIYITSIHDIDFKQKEFAVNLWLWLKYKNKAFDFDEQQMKIYEETKETETFRFIDWNDFSAESVTLPIDKIVANNLKKII